MALHLPSVFLQAIRCVRRMALAMTILVGVSAAAWSASGLDHAWSLQMDQTAGHVVADLADPTGHTTDDPADDAGDDESLAASSGWPPAVLEIRLLQNREPPGLVSGYVHQPEPPPDRMG